MSAWSETGCGAEVVGVGVAGGVEVSGCVGAAVVAPTEAVGPVVPPVSGVCGVDAGLEVHAAMRAAASSPPPRARMTFIT
jgi:hypothetical protein